MSMIMISFWKLPSTQLMMSRAKAMHNNETNDDIDDLHVTTLEKDSMHPNAVVRYGLLECVPLSNACAVPGINWTRLTVDRDKNDK